MDQVFAYTGLAEADVARAENYMTFLQQTAASKPGTHVFWGGTRYLNKTGSYLDVQTEEDKEQLNDIIQQFYNWGRPLPLCEILPKDGKFKLFLDLEIACGDDADVETANKLVDETDGLLSVIMKEIAKFFNEIQQVDAALFRSCGTGTDGIAKSTNRLHFPQIVVDKEGLWNVMLMLVSKLEKMTWEDETEYDPKIRGLKDRLQRLDQSNTFRNVVSQNGIVSKWGVRMPLCDKLTEKPYSQPVDRPLDPIRLERYTPTGSETYPKDTMEERDWVKLGSITCEANVELTEFDPTKIVRSTRMLRTGPGGSVQGQADAPYPTTTGTRKTIQMQANGVTADQAQREVLTSFAVDGDVLQGPQDNVSVTFSGDKIEVNGKPPNVRVVKSLLESIGATPVD